MKTLHTKIGDHYIDIKTEFDDVWKIIKQYFLCVSIAKNQPDMTVTITNGYGVSFQDYEVAIEEKLNAITFKRADYLIEVDSEYKSANVAIHDELALKHALMNLYSSFIVHHNWGILLHSSCVINSGKAHIFTGHSGAGKSTAAKLSMPRELLSDEATILKITEESVTVFNSPFRSELKAKGSEKNTPLGSIQLLHQALSNQRIEVRRIEALMKLIDKVFYWSYKPEETKTIMGLLQLLVKQVPVYELHFQKNNTFWELMSS
ncbi:hypothetical protein P8831_13760 [Priestia megaterium]|uniref:hypothetical protein n=1 Tax=Priestia megaterium TaxID=1404 RepID=UPI002D7E5B1C|nr:hypothetical protein [Priestia megaterium]MEB4869785.1 hypothetical protein [Priestia megaterium]